ncbi:Uncharacterised protein [Serratia marcescens]|nr:Uncharacterised protein [Serratia marcescens]CUY21399.1 Uncharacterised protein [Serratia marcescens]CUY69046.1 Uncharacterised protein [Serratia marcescens]CVE52544.1 Uncharacterised protein [Serratia marcescens]
MVAGTLEVFRNVLFHEQPQIVITVWTHPAKRCGWRWESVIFDALNAHLLCHHHVDEWVTAAPFSISDLHAARCFFDADPHPHIYTACSQVFLAVSVVEKSLHYLLLPFDTAECWLFAGTPPIRIAAVTCGEIPRQRLIFIWPDDVVGGVKAFRNDVIFDADFIAKRLDILGLVCKNVACFALGVRHNDHVGFWQDACMNQADHCVALGSATARKHIEASGVVLKLATRNEGFHESTHAPPP